MTDCLFDICGLHGGECQNWDYTVECDTVQLSRQAATAASRFFFPEERGSMFLCNIHTFLPNCTASHPSRMYSPAVKYAKEILACKTTIYIFITARLSAGQEIPCFWFWRFITVILPSLGVFMSRCNGLHTSGMLHIQLAIDILRQHVDPIFKSQEVQEDWTF